MPLTPGELISNADIEPYALARQRIERDDASTVVLVGPPPPDDASYTWAIVQRHVSGWRCLATGTHDGSGPTVTAGEISRRYGGGFDFIPQDDYGLIGDRAEIIHHRRDTPARIGAYCGASLTRPYNPAEDRNRRQYMQHCIQCTDTYRAEHYGRCPVMA